MDSKISLALGIIGTVLFTGLLIHKDIKQSCFTILICFLGIMCLALYGFPRLRELDLKNMKISLDKMKIIQKDVTAKEKDIKKVSLELARLIAFNSAFQSVIGNEDIAKYRKLYIQKKTKDLLSTLNIHDDEIAQIFKYQDAIDKFQNTEDKQERDRLWQNFNDTINKEYKTLEIQDNSNSQK